MSFHPRREPARRPFAHAARERLGSGFEKAIASAPIRALRARLSHTPSSHFGVAATLPFARIEAHYFKHRGDGGNLVTRTIEMNNYWNFASILYCANGILLPLVKLSLAQKYTCVGRMDASTPLMDVADALGAFVMLAYSVAVWL